MERAEYKRKKKELSEKNRTLFIQLAEKYALSRNTVKTGDFIKDHIGRTIKVVEIKVRVFAPEPLCIYIGPRYAQSGKPFKSGEVGKIYQENLKKESKHGV